MIQGKLLPGRDAIRAILRGWINSWNKKSAAARNCKDLNNLYHNLLNQFLIPLF